MVADNPEMLKRLFPDRVVMKNPNPWTPMSKPIDIKHLGKLLEEMGELIEAREVLELVEVMKEIADVHANIFLVNRHYRLGLDLTRNAGVSHPAIMTRDLGAAIAAVSRCLIQGIDECEPVTLKPNKEWLREALAAVMASTYATALTFEMDWVRMAARVREKINHLSEWHNML